MALFPSLPEIPHLGDTFKRFPKGLIHLLKYHDVFLREDSELSVAERELIAAYVSGLNKCDFCQTAHDMAARAFGVDQNLLEQLHENFDTAPVDEKNAADPGVCGQADVGTDQIGHRRCASGL